MQGMLSEVGREKDGARVGDQITAKWLERKTGQDVGRGFQKGLECPKLRILTLTGLGFKEDNQPRPASSVA